MVLDIQRCSLNDGPGIRTVVFLKGCPLKCAWCHNPESISARKQLMYDGGKCSLCRACARVCEKRAHIFTNGAHIVDRGLCACCGSCIAACPQAALKIVGEETNAQTVMDEVKRDVKYYETSGGGLTLSGGEPMYQPDFSLELLTRAKQFDIHTCVETSGLTSEQNFAAVLPYVDIFLFDYKATDPDKHKELTGASNALTLKNLEFLYNSGAQIILRCPLVPGVNDSPEHLSGIACLSKKYPGISKIEIMAYHNMGVGKAQTIGGFTSLGNIETTGEDIKLKWLEDLHRLGCVNVKIG